MDERVEEVRGRVDQKSSMYLQAGSQKKAPRGTML